MEISTIFNEKVIMEIQVQTLKLHSMAEQPEVGRHFWLFKECDINMEFYSSNHHREFSWKLEIANLFNRGWLYAYEFEFDACFNVLDNTEK